MAGCNLPGLVCREEFQQRVVLILYSKTSNTLAAINIKDPHRDAVLPGNAREEIGKWLGKVIVLDNKTTVWFQAVSWFIVFSVPAHT